MRTSIYIATHKSFNAPDAYGYIPIQVARAINEDLGYIGDNTGDNISKLNPLFGELTAQYWIWKNDHNSDILGLCHYRRYFVDEANNFLTAENIEKILNEYDIIVCSMDCEDTYYKLYDESHNINDLNAVGKAIEKVCPQYHEAFREVVFGKELYVGNLFITSAKNYKEYSKWLFEIFDEASKSIDVSGYDDYHKRVYGFLSEQLLQVWVKYNELKPYKGIINISGEKSETIEVKNNIANFIKENKYRQAGAYLAQVIEKRPDIVLPTSDIGGHIAYMVQVIKIAIYEEEHAQSSFMDYSNDIYELMGHYANIVQILLEVINNDLENIKISDFLYLKINKVSTSVIDYLMETIGNIDENIIYKKLASLSTAINEDEWAKYYNSKVK